MTKILRTLRNNWKKSVFGAGLISYGVNYGISSYQIGVLMRAFCEEAVKYGDSPVPYGQKHRRITVILNPAANKRRAKKNFEKYCAPLLYLSGVFVSVIETEKEGHAKQIIPKIDPDSDAIVVAGGDGTLSETITGLMRAKGEYCKIPIGVLPLGRTNTLANNLFGTGHNNNVQQMAEATMAVIKGNTKPIDALRIEPIDIAEEDPKPVYGVAGVEWGMWRDVKKRQDKLWYFGPFRDYASLVFPGHALDRRITAQIKYTPPCPGCSHCYTLRPDLAPPTDPPPDSGKTANRWWSRLKLQDRAKLQNQKVEPKTDYSKIINESCSLVKEQEIKCVDVSLTTNTQTNSDMHRLLLSLGPKIRYQGQFLTDGYNYIRSQTTPVIDRVEAKQIEIRPKLDTSSSLATKSEEKIKEEQLSIDSEDYEVRPIRVTVLPNSVKVFCS